ncbi:hypothetical protein GIB67_006721 [Kingdonia uniflora]|uniref:Uncharacterized protein n=1 Tax=Kingdonia uniflora TaxID=39325 RepID=A0A7J7LZ02_9MAGN|nr:hypothetical protein GIB67_006721 [Kingdonia uniflora]
MKGEGSYVPPHYIPLEQSDSSQVVDNDANVGVEIISKGGDDGQWSSGICACCDDMQSCCVGLICPCYLFGKNADVLGSGTMVGSCMTHFIICGIVNALCCVLTDGALLGLPGCFVACYACGYRRSLRAKYNLPEAPCGDLTTHVFCHLCAICQEYREICDRNSEVTHAEVTAPTIQTMESSSPKE